MFSALSLTGFKPRVKIEWEKHRYYWTMDHLLPLFQKSINSHYWFFSCLNCVELFTMIYVSSFYPLSFPTLILFKTAFIPWSMYWAWMWQHNFFILEITPIPNIKVTINCVMYLLSQNFKFNPMDNFPISELFF